MTRTAALRRKREPAIRAPIEDQSDLGLKSQTGDTSHKSGIQLEKHCLACDEPHPVAKFLPSAFTPDGRTDNCLASIVKRAQADRIERERRQAEIAAKVAAGIAPATKACRTCKRTKNVDQFSAHRLARDGRRHDCKPCVAAALVKSKARSAEARQRAKQQAAQPERRVANRLAVRFWMEQNPGAVSARAAVRRAVDQGALTPADNCQIAGCSITPVQGHHADYRRPLEVLWLCGSHHRRLHAGAKFALKPDLDPKLARVPRSLKKQRKGKKQ